MSGARRGKKRPPPTSARSPVAAKTAAEVPEPTPLKDPTDARRKAGGKAAGGRPAATSRRVGPPDGRTARRLAIISAVTIGVLCVFVLLQLRLSLIFADTTPIGGDFGAHSAGPELVRRHIWDHGLLGGWSDASSAGFPLYRFYMVVPTFFAAVAGYVLPAGVALKVMVALPLVLLPWAAAHLARVSGLTFPGQVLTGTASLIFLFDGSNNSLGGNVASTVVGEYAYAWSMLFCIVTLAVFARDLERGRHGPAAGFVGGIAALCHPIGAMFLVVGLISQVAVATRDARRAAGIHLARSLALAALIASFWYVPFLRYGDHRIDAVFTKRTDFGTILFPFPALLEIVFVALAGLAVYEAVRRQWRPITALAIVAAIACLAVLVVPQGAVNNGRLAPVWNLAKLMLAGVGASVVVAYVVEQASWKRRQSTIIGAPLSLAVVVLFCISWNIGTLPLGDRTTTSLGTWTLATDYQWIVGPRHQLTPTDQLQAVSFAGLERGPFWGEYQELVDTLDGITAERGCGRIGYEFEPGGRYGSIYALQLLPQFTDGCITTINGLLAGSPNANFFQPVAESAYSLVAERYNRRLPFEEPNMARGVTYLRELGCQYYLALTPEMIAEARATDGLTELATVGPWSVFEVADVALVEPLTSAPYVDGSVAGRDDWSDVSMAWFQQADPTAPRVSSGGADGWPASAAESARNVIPETDVSAIVDTGDSISFDVSVPGVPVLIRESYFPTWTAEGADGPFRVAPNWMVVVPTGTEVRLENRPSGLEVGASIATFLGLGACIGLAVWVRRRRPSEGIAATSVDDARSMPDSELTTASVTAKAAATNHVTVTSAASTRTPRRPRTKRDKD